MTQGQLKLLLSLKASRERGAASMSCTNRLPVANELERQGLIDQYGPGPAFYCINERGLRAAKLHRRDYAR